MSTVALVLLCCAYVGYLAWINAVIRAKEAEKLQRDLAFFELQRRWMAQTEFRDNKRKFK